MSNPLLTLLLTRRPRVAGRALRRVDVAVPNEVPTTDAIFVMLRRMRGPLITLIVVYAVTVFGLTLIPGVDESGTPYRMSMFDAFYVMSYTATTIGFGELPHPYTTVQRLWLTGSIYASVIGWAYTIGTLFALLQEEGFKEAVVTQRVRRKVRRLEEPFVIVTGYGETGREVCGVLDDLGRRFVVVDEQGSRIERLATAQLRVDAPGVEGDIRNPAVLGLAGLGHRRCEGVLALTDDDDANLAAVISVRLLRPDVPVIARASKRSTAERMRRFEPAGIINPYDDYGAYLILALRRPAAFQLVSWLMSPRGTPLPPYRAGLADGQWVVAADGRFGREVSRDLQDAGLEVLLVDPKDGQPDVSGACGFVAGAERDGSNLALAAHARQANPDIFIGLRQRSTANEALLEAFAPDSVFIPTQLVAREVLARVVTPLTWEFVEQVMHREDEFAQEMLTRLVERCGDRSPRSDRIDLDPVHAPAAIRWMRREPLVLRDLLRDSEDPATMLPLVPVVLVRDGETTFAPAEEELLRPGDHIVLLGRTSGFDALSQTVFSDAAVEHVATGRMVPSTWLWRRLGPRRRTVARGASGSDDRASHQ